VGKYEIILFFSWTQALNMSTITAAGVITGLLRMQKKVMMMRVQMQVMGLTRTQRRMVSQTYINSGKVWGRVADQLLAED
jgi:hypothetical protein